MIALSGLYLGYSYHKYEKIASDEAIILANSIESLLHPEDIFMLTGSAEDLQKSEYVSIKSGLMRLVGTAEQIHFAYLMEQKNGNLVFLLDSESPDSPNYSPPGQVYMEATENDMEPFRTGETVLTAPAADQWGTWISVLVPVKDENENVIAIFGLDYDAADWNLNLLQHMIPDMLIVISVFLLVIALVNSRFQRIHLKNLSKKLAYDEALYHGVFNQAPIGIAIVNGQSFITQSEFGYSNINPMFEQILGRTSIELEKIKWPDITYSEDLEADLKNFEQFKKGNIDGYAMEKRFIKPDNSIVWTNMKISNFLDNLSNPSHLCLLEDITARKETEETLKESERSKSVFLSNLPGTAYRCNFDRNWTMQFISDGCFELTGYHVESLLYNRELSFNDLIVPEYREIIWEEWNRVLSLKIPFRFEYEIITADGKRKWVLEHGQGVYNEQGEIDALEGIILDISASKEIENIFKFNSEHDLWTGLYNRRYLENLLKEDAKNQSLEKRAVVNINLSAIHALGLRYGFEYSRNLIKKIAKELETLCFENGKLFSLYENQFAYYITAYHDKNELTAFCNTLVDQLRTLLAVERIRVGVGILEIDRHNKYDMDQLLKNLLVSSEKAMNQYEPDIGICFFDKEMETQILREEAISRELSLIASGQIKDSLFLQYQPILDLNSDRICGFEALARLNSKEMGLVSPGEFIPIAEKTNLIIPLGKFIMQQAFHFSNHLKENGYPAVTVSINISAIQLLENDFSDYLIKTLREMNVDPQNIQLEITESIFASNHEEINRTLSQAKTLGIKLAIDDFGKGYSSLAREQELNANCLKIDKYFIDKLMSLEDEETITGDIISIGHKLGHCVIAEGVEYEKQLHYLKKHHCDKIQGYLFSKPLDQEAALELIQNSKADYHIPCEHEKNRPSQVNQLNICPNENISNLQLILDSTAEAICGIDMNGNCNFCNLSCLKILGYQNQEDLLGKNIHRLIQDCCSNGEPIPLSESKILQAIKQGKVFETDDGIFLRADGTTFNVEYHAYPQIKDETIIGAIIAFTDISGRKRKEAETEYLNYHDILTGLYNRRCFENNRSKIDLPEFLPLSVIFADINGLKMTNDIFGHAAGDALIKKSAEILLQSCRKQDVVARVGGDEFLLLLPKTSSKNAEKILSRIKTDFSNAHVEAIKCSISLGCDTKTNENQSLEMIITNAESAMYKQKTINRNNVNKDMIETIIKTLYTKNPREHRHSIAVSELCGEIGSAMYLPETEISKLKRVGYLHDIGKIILTKDILAKDTLTKEEKEKVQQHPVIGYRILNLFDDTLDLAEFVYGHHEKWDGTGYPRGLKGEQIPLISRIISIAEHYERKLNQGKTSLQKRKQAALEIIKKGAGTHFDPEIAELFISLK
ncbi:MAG TPA: EAL domain-containing protein, partial [Flexilinea sp.]|nr:EAL domain-containing protein [Flexilinea sp.]